MMKDPDETPIVPDLSQPGVHSRNGFRYQNYCVALGIIRGIAAKTLVAVDVELATDLVIHTEDGGTEFVSVKSREPHHTGGAEWGWGAINAADLLKHLYQHWSRSGRSGSATVWTNAGLNRDAASHFKRESGQKPPRTWSGKLPSILLQPLRRLRSFSVPSIGPPDRCLAPWTSKQSSMRNFAKWLRPQVFILVSRFERWPTPSLLASNTPPLSTPESYRTPHHEMRSTSTSLTSAEYDGSPPMRSSLSSNSILYRARQIIPPRFMSPQIHVFGHVSQFRPLSLTGSTPFPYLHRATGHPRAHRCRKDQHRPRSCCLALTRI